MDLISTFEASPGFFIAAMSALGLMVGSFLNVVTHRLPIMIKREWESECRTLLELETVPGKAPFNLVQPRSRCPRCKKMITAIENIPIVSFLALRGKCRQCGEPISVRYPIIEALAGIGSGMAAWYFGFGAASIAAAAFVWALIALAGIDIDTQYLPDSITLPMLWLGIVMGMFEVFVDLRSSVLGAVFGYLSLWSIYWLFKLATGKEGMGHGDFKLLAMLGAWLGWQTLPVIILLSSAVGAVTGVLMIVSGLQQRSEPIPFGPYLAGAGIIALFWGQALTEIYLNSSSVL